MTNLLSFEEILKTKSSDIERPKPLPVGTYATTIAAFEYGKSSQKQTPFVRFDLRVQGPLKDIDPDELEEYGNVVGKMIRATFYMTPDALYRISDFLDHCKVENGQDVEIGDRIEAAINCPVGALIKHRANDDGMVFTDFVRSVEL